VKTHFVLMGFRPGRRGVSSHVSFFISEAYSSSIAGFQRFASSDVMALV
jgi:hypothetical protein